MSAQPAAAVPIGLRPLGGDWETARMIGQGHWAIEANAWAPTFDNPGDYVGGNPGSPDVLSRWMALPAWPSLRALYAVSDETEAALELGPRVGGAYRRFFLRAVAPWGGEYLQALIQLGGGFHLASYKPYGYVRFPALYERGAWTFHVAPGGYYLFNQQPIVEVNLGAEFRPLESLQLGAHTKLRMDAKRLTPQDGTWSFGGGLRWQFSDDWAIQLEATHDAGPPILDLGAIQPMIEFPFTSFSGGVTYYHW